MPRKSFILSGLGGTIRDFVTTGLEIPQPDPVVGVSGPMVGDLQGVAVLSEALTTADVQSLMASAVWTDVSEDLDAAEPLIVDRGIHEDDPTVRVAATGVCTFAMDNSHRNSAETQSWYSPGHEDARPGFDRGAMVRVSMLTEDGTMIPQFYGKIRSRLASTAGARPPLWRRIGSTRRRERRPKGSRRRRTCAPINW
jgi:hypothetical protein